MARTVKFGLRCGENSVRKLDDLYDNFVIEDILAHYHSGQLQRWLKVWDYTKEFQQVESIKAEDDEGILRELIRIFDIEQNEQEIKAILEDLTHKSMQQQVKHTQQLVIESQKSNSDALCEYYETVNTILDNPFDMPKIRNAIYEIDTNYREIYDRDHKNLLYRLLRHAPLAVCVMLTRENMRKHYLPSAAEYEENEEREEMYYAILKRMYGEKTINGSCWLNKKILFENCETDIPGPIATQIHLNPQQRMTLKNGITVVNLQVKNSSGSFPPFIGGRKGDFIYHTLEPRGTKVMILEADPYYFPFTLRDADTHREVSSMQNPKLGGLLNGRFTIVNGIEFLPNITYSHSEFLYYIKI